MLPEPIENHVEQARQLLIGQFRSKPNIQGLLDSYARLFQELEDVFWDIIDSRRLDVATGAQLDTLGRLVREIRRGRSDAEFRVGIRIKIKVLRSKGRVVDVIEVASLANAPNVPIYEDHRYLNFHVEAYEQIGERFLAEFLTATRAASSYGCLVTSDLPPEELLVFDDETDPDPTIETFTDLLGFGTPGRLAAAGYALPMYISGFVVGDPTAYPSPRIDSVEEI